MMLGLRRRGKSEEADVVVPDGAGFARVLWPFERVLAPSLGTGASKTAQLSLRVPAERPVLTFRYGVDPTVWGNPSVGPIAFRVSLGGRASFEDQLDPARRLVARRSAAVALDLAEWPC